MFLKEKSVLFIYASSADKYMTHRACVSTLAGEYLKYGYRPLFVDLDKESSQNEILELVQRKDVVAVHCEQSWGVDLKVEKAGQLVNLFEAYAKPVMSHIRDYCFYPWLTSRIKDDSFMQTFFHIAEDAKEIALQINPSPHARHEVTPIFYPTIGFDPMAAAVPVAERPIKTLCVTSYRKPEEFWLSVQAEMPDLIPSFEAAVEESVFAYDVPIWQVAKKKYEETGRPFDFQKRECLFFAAKVQGFTRMYRRKAFMEALADTPAYIVFAGDMTGIPLHKDSEVHGAKTLPETMALMAQSRCVAVCHPPYPFSLSERFSGAMSRGAAVVANVNPKMRQHFKHGTSVLEVKDDFSDLADEVARLDDLSFAQGIADNGKEIAEKIFSPSQAAKKFMDALGLEPLI